MSICLVETIMAREDISHEEALSTLVDAMLSMTMFVQEGDLQSAWTLAREYLGFTRESFDDLIAQAEELNG